MNGLEFVPLVLATIGLAYASFKSDKHSWGWIVVAAITWFAVFLTTIIRLG